MSIEKIRGERIAKCAKSFGIPIEYARRIDKLINKREYEREKLLKTYLHTVITEAEDLFKSLGEIAPNDSLALYQHKKMIEK